jgi:hypothetical protein
VDDVGRAGVRSVDRHPLARPRDAIPIGFWTDAQVGGDRPTHVRTVVSMNVTSTGVRGASPGERIIATRHARLLPALAVGKNDCNPSRATQIAGKPASFPPVRAESLTPKG